MQIVGTDGAASDTEPMNEARPPHAGLSQAKAQALLQAHGPNALDTEPRRGLARRLLDMVREPMFVLLVAAAALYIALGDRLEGVTLSLFVLAMLGLTFWQEGRAESALQALRQLTEPMARVLRDGQERSIPAREVVPGDLLLLAEGDRIAADGWLLQAQHLQVDESLLTGESVPVGKRAAPEWPPEAIAPGGDDTPAVFAACHVVRGQGLAQVMATGARSQVGQIGAALAQAHPRVMGLQVGLGDLFEPLGIDRREVTAVQQVMFAVRMAAGEAGIEAFDGAFANVADTEGYLAEAQLAHRMGLSGKTCIHPSQIALANQVFRPTDAQIRHATQVVEAAKHYDAAGQGAFVVNGHMIDVPFLRRAQSILAQARRLGIECPA